MAKRKIKAMKRTPSTRRRRATPSLSAPRSGEHATELALAAFAHDVRTPLTGILAIGELLATSELDERERHWVTTLRSTAEHLASLTTLVVDAARAQSKGLVLRHELFDPRRLAESAGALFTARAAAKGLQSEITVASDLPACARGDLLRLRAVLENLLDNAVKFTEHGAVALSVGAEVLPRGRFRLVFSVSDSGIGISAAEIKRLFKPFQQASESIAQRYAGAGIGLAFAKRLARAMGGDLSVVSKAGQGSTFRLAVVVDDGAPAAATREQGEHASIETPSHAERPLHILCVEDNPYGRVVMNTILTQLGHQTDFLGTGDAAVEAVGRGAYDLVLMDIKLTGLGGFEATQRIRGLPGGAGRVPIIGISGHSGLTDEAARAAGMDVFLAKPVSPNTLADAIRKATAD